MSGNPYKLELIVLLCLQLFLGLLTVLCGGGFSGILFLAFAGLCLPCVILPICCLCWSKSSPSRSGDLRGDVSLSSSDSSPLS